MQQIAARDIYQHYLVWIAVLLVLAALAIGGLSCTKRTDYTASTLDEVILNNRPVEIAPGRGVAIRRIDVPMGRYIISDLERPSKSIAVVNYEYIDNDTGEQQVVIDWRKSSRLRIAWYKNCDGKHGAPFDPWIPDVGRKYLQLTARELSPVKEDIIHMWGQETGLRHTNLLLVLDGIVEHKIGQYLYNQAMLRRISFSHFSDPVLRSIIEAYFTAFNAWSSTEPDFGKYLIEYILYDHGYSAHVHYYYSPLREGKGSGSRIMLSGEIFDSSQRHVGGINISGDVNELDRLFDERVVGPAIAFAIGVFEPK